MACALLTGILLENVRSFKTAPHIAQSPAVSKTPEPSRANIRRIKDALEKAGLVPHEAKYWKMVEQ